MTTKYMKRGSSFHIVSTANLHLEPRLPVGTYGVVQDPDTGEIYLETIEDFPPLGKLYGDTVDKAERIWNTAINRAVSTGVLLSGEKGCGKTVLAKYLSIRAREDHVPTIVVNKPFCGEHFNQFIQSITQPCVIIFDEYEKVYEKKEQQDMLLTLFDGVFPTKKLFVLTSNDRLGVNNKMLNRPGRIFYALEYTGLTAEFIEEYCKDKLDEKAHTAGVVQYGALFEHFNFDMLKALVEEMNRYKENARQASAMMNMKVESWSRNMELTVTVDGKPVEHSRGARTMMDPMKQVDFQIYMTAKDMAEDEGHYMRISQDDLCSIREGVYHYERTEKIWQEGVGKAKGKSVARKVIIVARPATYKSLSTEELALVA